jgi:chromosome segregation protein
MRIKRLEITGFKSFMDRSVFRFDDGVTGVVGPNGCGKSNVVDAIRWVMGEQSAKNLRGRGMEDVIFNGSETKPPLNMAEVSLTFRIEPTDQLAPQYQGFSEVTTTRRLFRSGESEYLINKTSCRLLDIVELFLGTGVGTRAYSIIEQGRVGVIVSSKPEDRRTLIEEAAGVTKYKSRRKAAERKLEYTQQNLLRVADLVGELDRRLDSLSRQAKKAEKYKRLKAEIRELELLVAGHRHVALEAERAQIAERLANATGEEKEGLERIQSLEERIALARGELEREGSSLQGLSDEVHQLETQLQRDRQNLAHWEADGAHARQRIAEAEAERERLSEQRQAIAAQLEAREKELDGLAGSWKDDEAQLGFAQEALHKLNQQQQEVSIRLEQERAALVAIATRLANHESNLAALSRQKSDLEVRRARIVGELEQLIADERRLDESRVSVAHQVEESRKASVELAERKTQEEEALARTRQAFTENEILVISLREELQDKRSRFGSLQEIQQSYEGFDRGVRAVMLKVGSEARQAGVFGLVADVIATTPQYERAIEAALGERLQHVLVESREKGLELVEYLRSVSEGRSSFLPVPAPDAALEIAEPDLGREGVLAAAWKEVRCEEVLQPVVRALLGRVAIVQDLAVARAYAHEAPGFTLVTLDGEVLRPDGTVTGGVLEGAAVGALRKKREIAELGEEVGRVEERYNEVLTRHYGLQKQIGHAEGVLKGLSKNQHAEELNLATQEKDLHRAGEELARVRERVETLKVEEGQLSQALSNLGAEEESSRGEVAHGHTDRAAREERVRQLAAEAESLKVRAEGALADLTALKVKVASHSERGDSTRRDVERLSAQRADLEGRLTRLAEVLTESQLQVDGLAARIEETRASAVAFETQLSARQLQLEERRTAHAVATQGLKDEEGSLKESRSKIDALTHGLAQMSLRERELALELTHLSASIREKHQIELDVELERLRALELPEDAEPKLGELRGQVERMGEINLTAIEEHAELSQRHGFLAGQKKDLESSMAQLKEAIAKIDETSRERFKQTFEIVNDKFQQIFPRLFGGGRAQLVLTEEGPTAEPGIEIVAQPPGKKLQSVNLLSGGEKALTAVGLIFAIFLIKPTPFCLLDEVDAPLDEGNVGRYNEMVKEMSKQSQFILITHNKRTMEVADTLYGVTMEEPGISKLVSVNIHAAAEGGGEQKPEEPAPVASGAESA